MVWVLFILLCSFVCLCVCLIKREKTSLSVNLEVTMSLKLATIITQTSDYFFTLIYRKFGISGQRGKGNRKTEQEALNSYIKPRL